MNKGTVEALRGKNGEKYTFGAVRRMKSAMYSAYHAPGCSSVGEVGGK